MTTGAAARGKLFPRTLSYVSWLCLLTLASACFAAAQSQSSGNTQYVITKILFDGNRRTPRDTLLARILSRVGDPYNLEAVRADFQALWNTGFFEDIRLVAEDDPNVPDGKILIFYVKERPIIRRIEYKGNKSISESDILDRFKERKVGLSVESQFDPTKITRAEVVIKELLAEHGHQFATVKPTYERIASTNAVKLVFNIDEGPKVKVGKIAFQGNKVFSDRRLIRSMKNSRPIAIPLLITDINLWSKTYDRDKLDEDLEVGVRGIYQDNGYFKVVVKDPILKTVDEKKGGIPGVTAKHGKATNITIPIEEGEQYRMGKITFGSGDPDQNLFFKQEFLKRIFPLKEGDIFSAGKIRKALDNYKKLYGEYGYIDFTSEPDTEIDDAKKIINVHMVFNQEKQFYVRRIEFVGNTTTRDKVIRRELLLDEGNLYNQRLWELSILRLNQLNYFETIKPENAELKRNVKEGTVDIKLKVKEKGKQSISFSGGVSGLAGTFVGASYQTNNFLGLGETLTLSAQVGDYQRNLTFGFTEPYLFDRPIATGFTVFDSKFDYNQAREESILFGQQIAINPAFAENYNTASKGFTVFASYPMRRFSFARVGLTYGFSATNISAFSQSSQLLFEDLQFTSLAGPTALTGIRSSKITPSITYDRRNSGLNPTTGKMFSYAASFEGGPIGGNTNTIANTGTFEWFHPVYKHKNVIALRFLGAYISGYGGKVVPPFDRYYIGGENDIRGFNFYTISPYIFIPTTTTRPITFLNPTRLNQNGSPTAETIDIPVLEYLPQRPGGDTQGVFNFEYRIPIASPVTLEFFQDLGVDGVLHHSQLQLSESAVTLLQQEFPNPLFPNVNISRNLPLVSGTNFAPRQSVGVELVVQVPIINAPFRIYWAYNPLLVNETISGPQGAYYINQATLRSLPPGVLQTQIEPQLNQILQEQIQRFPNSLLEPRSTFRFTIGRTF